MAYVTAQPIYRALLIAALLCYTITVVSDVSDELTTSSNSSLSDKQAQTETSPQKITGVVSSQDVTLSTNPTTALANSTNNPASNLVQPKIESKKESQDKLLPLEQDIVALFKEFNDPKSTISWADFCHKVADILAQDTKYNTASTTFRDLSQSTWSIKIIWKLSSLKKYLPSHIADLFKGYSLSNFRTMLNKRLAMASSPSTKT